MTQKELDAAVATATGAACTRKPLIFIGSVDFLSDGALTWNLITPDDGLLICRP